MSVYDSRLLLVQCLRILLRRYCLQFALLQMLALQGRQFDQNWAWMLPLWMVRVWRKLLLLWYDMLCSSSYQTVELGQEARTVIYSHQNTLSYIILYRYINSFLINNKKSIKIYAINLLFSPYLLDETWYLIKYNKYSLCRIWKTSTHTTTPTPMLPTQPKVKSST